MKKIAILGASYLQLPIILRANSMGLETHVFATPDGAVAINHCYKFYPISTQDKEAILDLCYKIGIDGILTIASDIAVNTVNYVASIMNLNGNSIETSYNCTNKLNMKQLLNSNKIKTSRYWDLSELNIPIEKINLKFPLVVKPADRSGSYGVRKVDEIEDLCEAFLFAKSVSLKGNVLVEEYIDDAIEVSVESISFHGTHRILAITDKVTSGPPNFVEIEHHQPSFLSKETIKNIEIITLKALNALNIQNGASHTEFFVLKDTLLLNEIGARMGGDFIGSHLVQLSTGYDYLKAVIEIALDKKPSSDVIFNHNSGIIYKWERNYLKFKQSLPEGCEVVELQLNDSVPKKLSKSSERDDFLIYRSRNRITFAEL
jgi:biotin carboxylase